MKRPLAYITAPWGESRRENEENAARYCRQVYDAGYSPICPMLVLSTFLKDSIPQEHKDGLDMARDDLRRSPVLVVCGSTVTEAMKNDIAVAERLRITAASSQAPYRSPRRKRQGSFTPLLLLSPHNLRLCGGPFVDGILTVKGQGRKSCR